MTDATTPMLPAAPALPLDEADTLRIELNALRAEVADLRIIRDGAVYLHGAPGCAEDGVCEEGQDIGEGDDWLCPHVERRYATYADVHARQRLEWLVDEIRLIVDDPGADHREAVREAIHDGVYALVVSLQEVDGRADVEDREPYKSVLAESIGAFLEAAIRGPA